MPREIGIDDLPALAQSHVHMEDKAATLRAINEIIEDGPERLQVITDFDLTLTKQHDNGKQVLSSFGIFRKCKQLPVSYLDGAKQLYNIYRPIEIDPTISHEKKAEAMAEWVKATEILLRGAEFDCGELEKIVESHPTPLRDGTKELFEKLHAANVPVLVFSAGLGDVVLAILKYHRVLYDNVKVISNFLKYDGRKLDGFKNETLIHVYNKKEAALGKDYFELLKGRHNVLLMGDTTGDAHMADGAEDVKAVLKIGFLYDHVKESLVSYMEKFHIVLVDDQTMRVTRDILEPILQ